MGDRISKQQFIAFFTKKHKESEKFGKCCSTGCANCKHNVFCDLTEERVIEIANELFKN